MPDTKSFKKALLHHQAGELELAAQSYQASLKKTPNDHRALANLGIALKELGRIDEAIASCHKAITEKPDYANGWNNLGISLLAQGRMEEAAEAYRKAVKLDPGFFESWSNLGVALTAQGFLPDAIDCFEKALAIAPNYTEALTQLIHQSQQICRWDDLDAPLQRLVTQIKHNAGGINPFALLSVCNAPEDLLQCATNFSAKLEQEALKATNALELRHDWPAHKKLRIGYMSGNFRQHATAYLTAQLFESHDHKRFETFAYSYGHDDASPTRKRLVDAFDHFHDVRFENIKQTAKRINLDEIDILVDLKGYSQGARTKIMALRPAPVQVNFLGYPGTMGANFIDYIVVDRFIVPPGHEPHYLEKCVFMPDAYQPNDGNRKIAPDPGTRISHGLPAKGFVFCSFNQAAKITPEVFSIWMRLLSQVESSVLWLLAFNTYTEQALRDKAAAFGVDPERIIFAPQAPLDAHLARYKLADLFLDTFPCNAHTTASDALWGGCPVLTCAGETFASRVAGSLLRTLEMDDLITTSLTDYEALALKLAQEPKTLAKKKKLLAKRRTTNPLFDGTLFAKNLERGYETIWDRHLKGLEAESFEVPTE